TVREAKVLILDEPTSSLQKAEVDELFTVIRELRDAGVAILFVSHFLDQVYEISDRLTILRNGRLVGERLAAELPRRELIGLMIGREGAALDAIEDRAQHEVAADTDAVPTIEAAGLGRHGRIQPFDLTVL